MNTDIMPKSWNKSSKPHLFCPGCGHGIALKQLAEAIDELSIQRNTTLGIDIGCSLLAWNMLNVDTIQTHHGRTAPVMVGFKKIRPKRIVLAYAGDGGGYAIGLQSIIHAAFRNEPITVIIVNNENYAMTGGQMAPTTEIGRETPTSPLGKNEIFGPAFHGPELIRQISNKSAFIARATVSNPIGVKNTIKHAILNQINNNAFSLVEILSICPTNWKTDANSSFDRLTETEKVFPIGEILPYNSKEKK